MRSLSIFTATLLVFFVTKASAQRLYGLNCAELIFTQAQVKAADSIDIASPIRFSGWYNGGQQIHLDFNRRIGAYTGLQLRNIGMITKVDTLRIKHRAYALAIPIAIKLGDLEKKWFIAPGAQVDWMFNYKVKEFIRGRKVYKQDEWFSDKVEMFNPSVFLQVSLGGWGNIKAGYYLKDFLKPVEPNEGYRIHVKGGSTIPAYTRESKLFYISFMSTFFRNDKKKKHQEEPPSPPAEERRRNDA